MMVTIVGCEASSLPERHKGKTVVVFKSGDLDQWYYFFENGYTKKWWIMSCDFVVNLPRLASHMPDWF